MPNQLVEVPLALLVVELVAELVVLAAAAVAEEHPNHWQRKLQVQSKCPSRVGLVQHCWLAPTLIAEPAQVRPNRLHPPELVPAEFEAAVVAVAPQPNRLQLERVEMALAVRPNRLPQRLGSIPVPVEAQPESVELKWALLEAAWQELVAPLFEPNLEKLL